MILEVDMDNDTCVFCAQHRSEEPPVGGWVLRERLVSARILPGAEFPGWFVLQVNRHADGFPGMTEEEAAAIGLGCRALGTVLRKVTGEQRMYTYSIGENYPHFHMVLGSPPPAPERGRVLLTRILDRDAELLDEAKSLEVADRVRQALAADTELTGGLS
jgi:hypothetical protein